MTAKRKSIRVLIVDDDPDVVDYLVEVLRDEGYSAVGETSAKRALERLGTEPVEVLLADVEMPEMRGLALMDAVHARRPDQLVVLMTARTAASMSSISSLSVLSAPSASIRRVASRSAPASDPAFCGKEVHPQSSCAFTFGASRSPLRVEDEHLAFYDGASPHTPAFATQMP